MQPMHAWLDDLNVPYKTNEPLAPLTRYKVGGAAQVLAEPSSVQQLTALASQCHTADVPTRVLGLGANLLVADQGVDGVVVRLSDPAFQQVRIEGTTVVAGGGFDLAKLVLTTARAGLAGLECLAGIPASVGGAIRMNAGGVFGDIGQAVKRVMVADATGQVYYRDRDDLEFSYRRTNIVARYILSVQFDLSPDDPEALIRRVKEIFLYKRNTQPLREDSAGCAFKNPDQPDPQGRRLSAGQWIDKASLKNFSIGGARVSDHHANFIITDRGCTAGDVITLIDHVQKTVADRFGVALEREVVEWP